METTLASVNSTSLTLMELVEAGPFKEKIRLQTDETNSLFKDIVKRIHAHNEQLVSTIQQAQHIVENIRRLDLWIDDVTAIHLEGGVAADSKDELVQLEENLKVSLFLFIHECLLILVLILCSNTQIAK